MAKPVPGPIYEALYNLLGGNDGLPVQAANVADITDSSGGTGAAGGTIASGVGEYWMGFQLDLADIADGDLITDMTIGHKFKILDTEFIVTEPATTGGKATTLSLDIGTTAVTGSSLALTSANCTPAGAKVTSTTAMAANTGSASATLTLKAASTTAFGEGKGIYRVLIQNMDTADAFAVLAAQCAAIQSSLETAKTMAAS